MQRRAFLNSILATAGVGLLPGVARAAGECMRPDHLGVQRCSVGIHSNIANVFARSQENTQWCWAACIEMLFRYYNHPVSQARIVNETFGNIVNMPAGPWNILRALNRQWTDDNGRVFFVQADTMTANLITAHDDLFANNPLIVGTLGHAMVLTGISYDRTRFGSQITEMVVRDPWQRRGRRVLNLQEAFNISFLVRVRIT